MIIHMLELIRNQEWKHVKELLPQHHAHDIAIILSKCTHAQATVVFRMLPKPTATRVFSRLPSHRQMELLNSFSEQETHTMLHSLKPDDRTALFEKLPSQFAKRLLAQLDSRVAQETKNLLGYPPNSVGRLMRPDYIAVKPTHMVRDVLTMIKKHGKDDESINRIYVIDSTGKLIDDIRIGTILVSSATTRIQQLLTNTYTRLKADESQEQAVFLMRKYGHFALPVVDSDEILLGTVTADDIMQVAEKETTEDFYKTSSVAPLKTNYHDTSIWNLVHRRVWWLSILVLVSLISSGVIAHFEAVLASAIALVFFIPLLIDSGGNTGSQSATLVIRAIATRDITLRQWYTVFIKEVSVGLILGGILGLLAWGMGLFRADPVIGVVVGLTMVCIILLANLLGAMLPFVLCMVRMDPAVASAPLITSLVDVMGLIIYLSLATLLL